MNIHHLELFYHVAKHGGIAAAVRKMPYGIQQPAVSGQIARLEESLGTKLFNRRPFALLPAGLELFEFTRPFFDEVEVIGERIRGGGAQHLRLAAPAIVLHDYLPRLLERVRKGFPKFRLSLHEAGRAEAERLLQNGDVDLAITAVERRTGGNIQTRALLELPLVLLIPSKHRLSDAEELWSHDTIEETLITFPRSDPLHAIFQRGLDKLGAEWFPGIEVNSARLIECYVAHGYGIGVSVATPGFRAPKGVRALELANFPRVVIGAAWGGQLTAIAQRLLFELQEEATHIQARVH
ncbi:MAG: LysR substrate-binding domain-containing protein [Chthoniobacterales bacterium]